MESAPCLKATLFGHDSIENRTLVPENRPFRARPQRAPSACTSGMKPHSYTHQNYTTASTHYVIPSAAKNLHGTAFTFVIKLQQVPVTLKETACSFVTKSLQVTRLLRVLRALWARNCIRSSVVGNSQALRTALASSRLERLTCSRRIPYIPATVPRICISVPL